MTPIQAIMADLKPRDDAKPVIFNGYKPRLLGYAATHRDADLLAIMCRVTCRYTSTARCNFPDGSISGEFFLLHS